MDDSSPLSKIPLTSLKGVGPKMAQKLQKMHLNSVLDVLFHLPNRYQDRTRVTPIAHLRVNEFATIVAQVLDTRVHYGKRRALLCRVNDGSGTLTLRFFQFSAAQQQALATGTALHIYGEVRPGPTGPEIIHPEYKATDDGPVILEETLTPIYPTTEGVYQPTIRNVCEQALSYLNDASVPELLPAALAQGEMPLAQAIRVLHNPPTDADQQALLEGVHPAQRRLALEELLAHHVSMLIARQQAQQVKAASIQGNGQLTQAFLKRLPFSPTGAQKRVAKEIATDMAQPFPMLRLVQGDVGSGKTLVAALAALPVIEAGYQVALMAPTEILAEQHALNFALWFEALGIEVGWLAGKTKGKAREATVAALASGHIQFIVGTHALFQAGVEFQRLALVIIDEQHRFGVHQRLALREKGEADGSHPHQLIMTATPIPRTLAMTAYADLATSIIDELPPGRTPITTVAIPDTRRDQIIQRVYEVCRNEGRQAYWVCTLIEESEALQCQAAEDTATLLAEHLPGLRIGLVHGRMKAAEKEAVMHAFKAAELDLLVATTVIEVGVDVPNASLMIIENPERLGLAQLHQLRGRVGRGSAASHCVLLYKTPLSQQANQRLAVLRDSNDGFVIAERDLELRGPGELLGAKQTGLAQMKVADVVRDAPLIPKVQQLAQGMVTSYPDLSDKLMKRWLPQGERYAQV
ncbi:ATP-dependent DNA helicase RecG [Aliidiomarina maris]|uniref:ATP-dependent DNA helicase RecG n=1 Tax=Aliidiomarina maris TaxID=531312 RepID=A0A327X065_9GAMM|nr:ATP-dependent DNA helicase RecG [Aliidiomarina maris]MBA3987655.1 ATP-dependent DNA helicase RecG [Idiomarina sp.]RAJ98366.1 ATP-dependent DNA helicase RecG [Aliidiomarina maris]RUO24815.1 ATP-dependent DNA helicase RecG [Aliidiomarina maris]